MIGFSGNPTTTQIIGERSPESTRRLTDTPGLTGPLSKGVLQGVLGTGCGAYALDPNGSAPVWSKDQRSDEHPRVEPEEAPQ
jgi:hypothetical protein